MSTFIFLYISPYDGVDFPTRKMIVRAKSLEVAREHFRSKYPNAENVRVKTINFFDCGENREAPVV